MQETPRPVPTDGQVLIRVHAATVNRTDCAALAGRPAITRLFTGFPRPRRSTTGSDFAGEIVALGGGVTQFHVGDRVCGFNDLGAGSHAEYTTFPADGPMIGIPDDVAYDVAASSLEGAHYARNFINKVQLHPGQRVLVNGATGAIGSAAVQLLKNRGLHITAVCGAPQAELVRALGPDRIVDYLSEDFSREPEQYDFIFDAVGTRTFGECRRVLTPRGIYISSELGPGGQNLFFALVTPLLRRKRVVFPLPVDVHGTLKLMMRLLEENAFTPLIDRRYRLDQIRGAFDYAASGKKVGNVLVTFD